MCPLSGSAASRVSCATVERTSSRSSGSWPWLMSIERIERANSGVPVSPISSRPSLNVLIRCSALVSNARRMLLTSSKPEPTTVMTIKTVVVRIILNEILGPPLLAIRSEIMPLVRGLATIRRWTPSSTRRFSSS